MAKQKKEKVEAVVEVPKAEKKKVAVPSVRKVRDVPLGVGTINDHEQRISVIEQKLGIK